MIKRFTLALFALVTCVIGASAATVYSTSANGKTFYYVTNTDGTNTVTITNKTNSSSTTATYSGSVTIPETFTASSTTYTVTQLADYAFYKCTSLTSVTIPATVTTIGKYCFVNCTKLATVTFSEGSELTTISASAFYSCSKLTSIEIPEEVTSIGTYAFYSCSALTKIKCKATSVPSVESSSFTSASALTYVYVRPYLLSSYVSTWSSLGSSVFYPYYDLEVGESCVATICLPFATVAPDDDLTYYTISTDDIGYKAIYISQTLGQAIVVEIPSTTYLSKDTPMLVVADEAGTYEFLGRYSYSDSSYSLSSASSTATLRALTGVYQSTTVTQSSSAYKYVLDTDTGIFQLDTDVDAFTAYLSCSTSYSSGIAVCDTSGLYWITNTDGTNTVTLVNAMTSSSPSTFYDSYSGNFEVPETFMYCGTTYTVTQIGQYCFQGCTELTKVTLPSTITTIGTYAFDRYSTTKYTAVTSVDLSACTSLTSLGNYAFRYCTSLKSINLSKCTSLTTTGSYTFYGCTALTSATLPSSLTSIGSYAFYGCTALTSATLPSSLTSIGSSAFYNCTALTSVGLSSCTALKTINASAFYNCKVLNESITLPSTLTTLGAQAFYSCAKITCSDIPDGITALNNRTFYGCTSLDSITLPENLATINYGAFYGCTGLTTIKCKATSVPAAASNTSNSYSAFHNCSALSKIYVRPYLLADYQGFETTASHAVWETPNDSVYYPYYDLTVSSAEAATLCLPFTSTIPDGVKLYTLDLVQKSSTDSSQYVAGGSDITDDADTLSYDLPVYVTAEAGTYEFLGYYDGSNDKYHLSETTATATEGVLTGVYQATTAEAGVYVLQNQGSGAKFYPVSSSSDITIGQFRAYLTYDEDSSAKSISFGFNDDDADNDDNQTTDISGVSVAESSLDAVYTLQGVRVAADNLQRGIYIRDGKKFVVK